MTQPALSPIQRLFTRKLVFWACLIGGLALDLATKAWAEAHVKPSGDRIMPVIDGLFAWKWAENEGAAFSIFHGNVAFLAIVASVVLGAVFVYMYTAPANRWGFLAALGLVASGAIGNLHDRLLHGKVRDFLFFDFDLPFSGPKNLFGFTFDVPQRWPVFNVADMAIMAGVAILLLQSFQTQQKPSKKPADEPEAETPVATKPAIPTPQPAHTEPS